jgi:thiamine biosynthesis lipoprotein
VGLLVHFSARPRWIQIQESRILMGTQVDVLVRAKDRRAAERGLRQCFKEMERIQKLMDVHQPESQLSQLNRWAGDFWVAPHRDILYVIQRSLETSRLTEGAFDVTMGPLIALWREARKAGVPPSQDSVRHALGHVGYSFLEVDTRGGRIRFRRKGMSLDLGGIAKGFALDRAAAALREEGIEQALLNAGGDVVALGGKGDRPWTIGIRDPRDPKGLMGTLKVRGMAVMTSGDYERFFLHQGRRYHHILDPRTGYPARGCISVTVVGPDATRADALATAAFVLGPRRGLALLEMVAGIEGIVVDEEERTFISSGLKGKVDWMGRWKKAVQ